jgi:hypothetical protein
MKRFIFLALIVTFFISSSSCKKKEEKVECVTEETPVVSYDNYYPLKVGNYWIYERYQINGDNTTTKMNEVDSSYVEKDTLINNKTYYKLIKYDFVFDKKRINYLRDSLDYIVTSDGTILFSSKDFRTTFYSGYNINEANDTILYYETKMADPDYILNFSGGSYNTSAMKTTFMIWPKYAPEDLRLRSKYNRFTKDIGLVSETEDFYATMSFYRERRLVRYHLN